MAGIRYLGRKVEEVPAKELRGMADAIRQQIGSGVVAIVSVVEGKAALVVSVSDDLKDSINAVELVRVGVSELGGKGGGPDGGRAEAALEAIARSLAAERAAAE